MSQKVLENLIRDLQKTVLGLSEKISSLESKIDDQNVIIDSQMVIISQLKCYQKSSITPEESKKNLEKKALQRPVRQARLKTASGDPDALKRCRELSEVNQSSNNDNSNDIHTSETTKTPTELATIQNNISQINNSHVSVTNDVESNEKNWKKVHYRSRTNKRQVIRGSGSFDCELQTVERVKKIHACFFKPDTTEDALRSYMEKKCPDDAYIVEKMKLKHNYYASFIIKVPSSKFEYFMCPDNWPPRTEVSEWFRSGAGRAVRPPFGRGANGHTGTKQDG